MTVCPLRWPRGRRPGRSTAAPAGIARATGRPFVTGEHDRGIVEQVVRDLAQTWTAPPITVELGDARWVLGAGEPVAVVRSDDLDFLCHLSGRDGDPALDVEGDASVATAVLAARVVF
ncbi:hypothetical protein [Lentzea terrae]|uniref:hypothetical protein n=1 Tax=Lentzea terrae TaxID=2200761 RepID=UPI000DD44B36|nr:hypothetical protein [Lentzea terrae]